ncbi:MAG: nucleotidyltransferase [Phycisphaera sp.]|nr:nucleotidyltransferase [Phycisphaera sp.]
MVTSKADLPMDEIVAFCQRWKITELSLFGSILREDFGPDSDVDVLVTFANDADWSLWDLVPMQDELSRIMGRSVDLVERRAVEQSRNYVRRHHILSRTEPIYAAR